MPGSDSPCAPCSDAMPPIQSDYQVGRDVQADLLNAWASSIEHVQTFTEVAVQESRLALLSRHWRRDAGCCWLWKCASARIPIWWLALLPTPGEDSHALSIESLSTLDAAVCGHHPVSLYLYGPYCGGLRRGAVSGVMEMH